MQKIDEFLNIKVWYPTVTSYMLTAISIIAYFIANSIRNATVKKFEDQLRIEKVMVKDVVYCYFSNHSV